MWQVEEGKKMLYRQITTKEIVNIKCTVEEYNKKEFKSYLKCALESKVNKIEIEK